MPPSMLYILDNKDNIVPCGDVVEWGKWMVKNIHRRNVKNDTINGIDISTMFLGQNNDLDDPPLVFVTIVVGGKNNGLQMKASTWQKAEENHTMIVNSEKKNQEIEQERKVRLEKPIQKIIILGEEKDV